MIHDQLRKIIERYTPTLFDIVQPAPADDIRKLEAFAGPLPESYREFLDWMGNKCLFLDGEQLAYSPTDLLEMVYEDPDIEVPDGYIWFGVDKSGTAVGMFLRRRDGAVAHIEYHEDMTERDAVVDNLSFASYLITAYVRRTLVPSHEFHFAAALGGADVDVQSILRSVDDICSHFNISHPISLPDVRFLGGDDFVVALHRRPQTSVIYLYVGALEQRRYEVWYDLVFGQGNSLRMPE